MLAVECNCARHIFRQWTKCVAMVTAYYAKNCGGKAFSIKFGRHVGLEVKMCKTHFNSGGKFVAMVTTYAKNVKNTAFQKQFK